MLKQIIAIIILILLSVLIILFMPYAQMCLEWILSAHNWVAELLTQVFSGGQAGDLTRKLLVILTIPIAISLIPVIIYWIAKRSWFPYFMQFIWFVWLIQVTGLILQYKVGS